MKRKDDIGVVEPREAPAEALEPSEQSPDLIAPLAKLVVFPRSDPIPSWRNPGHEAAVMYQSAGFIVLVCPAHDQECSGRWLRQSIQELSPVRGALHMVGRERQCNDRLGIRGNHMKSGVPAAPGLADGSRFFSFRVPSPSGWALMLVLSRPNASILIRMIRSRCSCSNTRSSTPCSDHRFIRMQIVCRFPKCFGSSDAIRSYWSDASSIGS